MSSSHSDSEDYESDETEEEEEEFREDMRVFLRLRPMNKLETSRRSKNCIELTEDPTIITVDSPLEGEYDFSFDHVFEEYASQEEVYERALQDIPGKLMEGFNCTVIAYGQTGTGKTHTMMGANGGSEGLVNISKREGMKVDVSNRSVLGEAAVTTIAPSVVDSQLSEDTGDVEKAGEDANPEAEGMIAKTITQVFEKMNESSSSTEFIVRCSYVEIYLEKMLDLLQPHNGKSGSLTLEIEADKAAGVGNSGVRIVGASELCCFDVGDVCTLLARGNACRTMSATEMNTDSSRSHAVFVMRIQQFDRISGKITNSMLHMLDLAGSELAANPGVSNRTAGTTTAVQVEAKMINKSLNALQKMIRAQLENQRGANIDMNAASRQSKITRLLRPSFGGNCLTTLILTASPSSYNIGETISTIRFGQRCRKVINHPSINSDDSSEFYRRRLLESDKKYLDAMVLLRSLANKCQMLRIGSGEPTKGTIWETIDIITSEDDGEPVDFTVTVRHRKDKDGRSFKRELSSDTSITGSSLRFTEKIDSLEEELSMTMKARDEAENLLGELQSEVAVLRAQNENLTADKKRRVTELMESNNEVQMLSQRKLEVEHNLRTSQFRENEAIVFLRQFRRFYTNVLKDKAAHGAGSINAITTEITHKVPNAPDLNLLRDIDEMLLESGLLEEHEIGGERSSAAYKPTKDSLMRSAAAASRAARVELELNANFASSSLAEEASMVTGNSAGSIRNLTGSIGQLEAISEIDAGASVSDVDLLKSGDHLTGSIDELNAFEAGADAGAGISEVTDLAGNAHSITRLPGTGMVVTRQQKALRTPSGRLVMMREKDMERELIEMSEKCIMLQTALNEEKAIVDALTNKAGGMSKKKLAQDAILLRQQLDKKTASLTAIAWKMNELNLINKTYNEKMVSREQHVLYLEENLVELQDTNRRLIVERQENEKKLRDEIEQLMQVVEGVTLPLWQLGESKMRSCPLSSRILVPVPIPNQEHLVDDEPTQRRLSTGAIEPDVDQDLAPDGVFTTRASMTHAPRLKTMDVETQTDNEMVNETEDIQNQKGKIKSDAEEYDSATAKFSRHEKPSLSDRSNEPNHHKERINEVSSISGSGNGAAAEVVSVLVVEEADSEAPEHELLNTEIEHSSFDKGVLNVNQGGNVAEQKCESEDGSEQSHDSVAVKPEHVSPHIDGIMEEDEDDSELDSDSGEKQEPAPQPQRSDSDSDDAIAVSNAMQYDEEGIELSEVLDGSGINFLGIEPVNHRKESGRERGEIFELQSSAVQKEFEVDEEDLAELKGKSHPATQEFNTKFEPLESIQKPVPTKSTAVETSSIGKVDSADEDYNSDDNEPSIGSQWVDGVPSTPSRQQTTSASASLNDGLGLNDDFDYDDLGKKWGMSESEIAEDAAILTPRRRDSDDENLAPPASTALAAALYNADPRDSDEESINKWVTGTTPASIISDKHIINDEGNEFKPEPKGWRTKGESKSKVNTSNAHAFAKVDNVRGDEESMDGFPGRDDGGNEASYDDDLDDNDTYDESLKRMDKDTGSSFSDAGGSKNSLNDDDFEMMMDEAAAALAAAQALIPTDDDLSENDTLERDQSERYQELETPLYEKVATAAKLAKPTSKLKHVENYSYDNLQTEFRKLTDEQLKGGKPVGYEPYRFVNKVGPGVKPAVLKEGKKSLLPEYDDYSVSVAPDSHSISRSISQSIREHQITLPETKENKKTSKRHKERHHPTSSRPKVDESTRLSSRKERRSPSRKPKKEKDARSPSRKAKAKEAERVRSKSRSTRHHHEEAIELRRTHGDDSDDDNKEKGTKVSHSEDKKKKSKHHHADDDRKKSKKKRSDIHDHDEETTKKKKSISRGGDDLERPRKSRSAAK